MWRTCLYMLTLLLGAQSYKSTNHRSFVMNYEWTNQKLCLYFGRLLYNSFCLCLVLQLLFNRSTNADLLTWIY